MQFISAVVVFLLLLSMGQPAALAQDPDRGQAARLVGLEGGLSPEEQSGIGRQEYWDNQIIHRERNGDVVTCVFRDRSHVVFSVETNGSVRLIDVFGPAGTYRGGVGMLVPGIVTRLLAGTPPRDFPDTPSPSERLLQLTHRSGIQEGLTDLVGVAYGNGVFVAVGSAMHVPRGHYTVGVVMSSANAREWRLSIVTPNISAVSFVRGAFYAIGWETDQQSKKIVRRVLRSVDGLNWSPQERFAGHVYGQVLENTRQDGDLFKIIEVDTADGREFLATTAKTVWGTTAIGAMPRRAYEVVGSKDLDAWETRAQSLDVPIEGVAYGNGFFVVLRYWAEVGSSAFAVSAAAKQLEGPWVIGNSSTAYQRKSAIAFGRGLFVAVGYGRRPQTEVLLSKDGLAWETVKVTTNGSIQDVAYGDGVFVGVGGDAGIVICSSDCRAWTVVDRPRRVNLPR